ncbi:sulfide/dihydroorotate dehydrogenase-like FAD/NAD-binding protein [Clostridium aestuarii]|uniref:Sulfide/dihydroorotate dehydrogenase-like FAD/NAD-binding protein n=1 Tax=Clostridium aestuarii TaxID=338193 RepID=A0ABT4CYN3_9CLOT|nr:sulfide/dihydroorotate dehydrogenase-like FAD/NAD-binding protein [Clostridium aestuarii]MCY6484097.1 sulfide/dihydroorotate dehydrogenase-like FAD/NAD-binding protein [Clostridium aestuarii]
MKCEIIDCIDAGTEYCPCHLAETGDCILCSELSDKKFCDCVNWNGTCIYQEYILNGSKAKEGRKNYLCRIVKKEPVEGDLIILTIKVSHGLVQELVYPGSFVFLRNPSSNQYYDSPISIMEADRTAEIIKVAIEVKGTKTKKIDELKENDNVLVKGPFWNGVLGVKHVYNAKNGHSIIIARGIGIAPMIPVLRKLHSNGNKVTVIFDKANYKNNFVKKYLEKYDAEVIECCTFNAGEITEELKNILSKIIDKEEINLIHCSAVDILIYKILEFIDEDINYSCCNNAKMCCGEGTCGACTVRFKGHKLKRLCKLQTDPRYIFEGRRLI